MWTVNYKDSPLKTGDIAIISTRHASGKVCKMYEVTRVDRWGKGDFDFILRYKRKDNPCWMTAVHGSNSIDDIQIIVESEKE